MTEENVYSAPKSELLDAQNETRRYAGFWIRTLASIIDTLIMMAVTFPILTAIYGENYWLDTTASHGFWDILISYVFPAVAVIMFWIYRSATPGKILLGLKVISLGQSETLSTGQAIGRYFAYIPSMIVLGLGFLWVAFDGRKQGWHDKLANTTVVRK